MTKNLIVGTILVRLAKFAPSPPPPPPPIFFRGFYLYELLDIVSGYHCMQFQGKVMKQTS